MEVYFKFEIGEIVYHKIVSKYNYKEMAIRTPLIILERVATEFKGGVQLTYKCRLGLSGYAQTGIEPSNLYIMQEVELERKEVI